MGLERGRALGMPLEMFTEQAWAGLVDGKEHILVGMLPGGDWGVFNDVLNKKKQHFKGLDDFVRGIRP